MENCLSTTDVYFENEDNFKAEIERVIEEMICDNERLVFAEVAEKAGVTRFIVRRYPELRNYILKRMMYYKDLQVINQRIDRAVSSLLKSNKKITFIAIIGKCKFTTEMIYQNPYIRDRIRNILATNNSNYI